VIFALVGLAVFVVGVAIAAVRYARAESPPATFVLTAEARPPPREPASRDELAQKLKALKATRPEVKNERAAATCYRQAAPPETADYLCPVCGARTQWTKNHSTGRLIQQLVPALRAKRSVPGLKLSLDERQLCRTCTPKAPGEPTVTLVVEYPDGTVHRAEGVDPEDLVLLQELLAGKDVHRGARDKQSALKEHLPRLQVLLGVKPAK